jgi:hypothetical protein
MKRLILPGVLLGAVIVPGVAHADEIYVKGGGHVTGQIVERRADAIVVDIGIGRIGLPPSYVERIETGPSPHAVYDERAGRLAPQDSRGWVALGEWARGQDLSAKAKDAFERALAADPANAAAHRALGHVLVDGQWVTAEEANRARGLVLFEGSWISPEERKALLDERAAAAEESRARAAADSEARVREAEARADAAEAEAERAQAELEMNGSYGMGLGYGYGLGYGLGYPVAYGYPFGNGFSSCPTCARSRFHSGFQHRFPGSRAHFRSSFDRFRRLESPPVRVAPSMSTRAAPRPLVRAGAVRTGTGGTGAVHTGAVRTVPARAR